MKQIVFSICQAVLYVGVTWALAWGCVECQKSTDNCRVEMRKLNTGN